MLISTMSSSRVQASGLISVNVKTPKAKKTIQVEEKADIKEVKNCQDRIGMTNVHREPFCKC